MALTADGQDTAGKHLRSRRIQCVALGLVTSAFAFYLYFHEPTTTKLMPVCVFHSLTGWYCPGCGGLRAAYHLMHGDWWGAFRFNPLLFLLMPFFAWWYGRTVLELFFGWRFKKAFIKSVYIYGLVGLFSLFWIVRNLPGFTPQ